MSGGKVAATKEVKFNQPAPFVYDDKTRQTAAVRWAGWIEELNDFLDASGIKNDQQKISSLRFVGGEAVRRLIKTKCQADTYDGIVKELTRALVATNTALEVYKLDCLKQNEGESLDDFCMRARALAMSCGFGIDEDQEVKRALIRGCLRDDLRVKMLARDRTLDEILELARSEEIIEPQVRMARESQGRRASEGIAAVRSDQKEKRHKGGSETKRARTERKCYACGGEFPHKGDCPAKTRMCYKCKKEGHFGKVCKDKASIRMVSNEASESEEEDSRYIFGINTCGGADGPHMMVKVDGQECRMLIDSGAGENIVDLATYLGWARKPKLKPSSAKLRAYNSSSPLVVKGELDAMVDVNGKRTRANMKVVEGAAGCLLGYKLARELGLFQAEMFMPEAKIRVIEGKYGELMRRFSSVFTEEVGELKDYEVKLHIDSSVEPKQTPYRRAPYHLLKAISVELDKLVKNDIIEPVTKPPSWVSAMVAVPKPKKPGEVRITIDSRLANKAIKRIKYATPTTEEIMYDLNGAKKISRIDLNKAFHQLVMAEESRDITTFTTHKGLFRFKRLNMGVCCASELFQHVIQQRVINGLEGVRNLADDIIVFGKTEEEHDQRLERLCERLKECGLTASPNNCVLGVSELIFFGLNISANGVAPGEDKAKAIKEAGPPSTTSELRSFLGLAIYCSTHIPNLATIAEPLWQLLKAEGPFEWKEEHQGAMDKIKEALVTSALGYFDVDWHTEVTVDASPVGLAAIIAQVNPRDSKERKVITYASRLLSDTERRYAQVEKEALAVVWACERFRLYLAGKSFTMVTDNKAVELIYSNPKSKPPARIERWALRLMSYDFNIVHKPGKGNIADYLSRQPVDEPDVEEDEASDEYINFVAGHSVPRNIKREELAEATKADKVLMAVGKLIKGEEMSVEEKSLAKPYEQVREQLTVLDDGLMLRERRLVIPEAMQKAVVAIAHEGHLGMTKTKGLLRTKVWFPAMNQMVEEAVKACLACQLESSARAEPVKSTELPAKAWERLAMDFFGPLPNNHELMVVMDEFSRFPVVMEVKSTAAEHVVPALRGIFGLLGIPSVLKTDNGPPFNGGRFSEFCEHMGIKHRKITPEHPQANGQSEVFMRPLAKTVRAAINEKKDWREVLDEFLRAYRSAPHSTTGVAPAQLLYGRSLTTRLPSFGAEEPEEDEALRKRDAKTKLKAKTYADKRRRACESDIKEGDTVLARQKKTTKFQTKFGAKRYRVVAVKGSMVTAEAEDGHRWTRDASFFKRWDVVGEREDRRDEESGVEIEGRRYPGRERKKTERYDGNKRPGDVVS